MARRIAIIAAGILVGWSMLLLVLGIALGAGQERRTKERLAASLQATVTLANSDLALIRGHWAFEELALRHDDVLGKLSLDVRSVRCELAPLGWALVDRDCGELAVRGVRMEVSSTELFRGQRPKQKPTRADRVVIDDAELVFLPSAITPSLGGVSVTIEHAESGPTLLRTPLSWLFTLEVLRAKLALPAGITLQLGFQHGMLSVASSLFGSAPVELPVLLPIVDTAHEAGEEMTKLVELGKGIAERLVAIRAQQWLESKLKR